MNKCMFVLKIAYFWAVEKLEKSHSSICKITLSVLEASLTVKQASPTTHTSSTAELRPSSILSIINKF
jgi:hypothetical protein